MTICQILRISLISYSSVHFSSKAESKISSRVELFVFAPDTPTTVVRDLSKIKFKRLGYLSLDSNERSGYQARELKSVYVDSQTMFLKIILNKCHINKFNLCNQVGLVALNCLGELLSSEEGVPTIIPQENLQAAKLEDVYTFDQQTAEKLKALDLAKDKAIENEDYDEARRLKESAERLRAVGFQLLQLEERKKLAVRNEDFDSAKIIKQEIDRLRAAVAPPPPLAKKAFAGQLYEQQPMPIKPNLMNDQPMMSPQFEDFQAKKQAFEERKRQYEDQPASTPPLNDFFSQNPPQHIPIKQGLLQDHDQQVIPTLAGGLGPGLAFEEEQQAREEAGGDNLTPETLGPQQAKMAEAILPLLGEDICRRLFSKQWTIREDGLGKIEIELKKGPSSKILGHLDNSNLFNAITGALRYTVGDKIQQVSLKAMMLLKTLLDHISPPTSSKGVLTEALHAILQGLLEKAGDVNVRVRDQAEQSYMQLARSPCVGAGNAVQHILKPIKEQKQSSHKHIIGRLSLLKKIVEEFKINNQEVPFGPVAEFALNGFKNSNGEIRTASYHLLLSIYALVGPKLNGYLSDLRPAQIEMLQKGFAQVEGKDMKEEQIKPQKQQKQQQQKQQTPPQQQGNSQCHFCGKRDPGFISQEKLDLHLWKDCPMLVQCPGCKQVIETIQLNNHQIQECDNKHLFKQCPRCNEAINAQEFDQHLEDQTCNPQKPPNVATRCPLCHEDVAPGNYQCRSSRFQVACVG